MSTKAQTLQTEHAGSEIRPTLLIFSGIQLIPTYFFFIKQNLVAIENDFHMPEFTCLAVPKTWKCKSQWLVPDPHL